MFTQRTLPVPMTQTLKKTLHHLSSSASSARSPKLSAPFDWQILFSEFEFSPTPETVSIGFGIDEVGGRPSAGVGVVVGTMSN